MTPGPARAPELTPRSRLRDVWAHPLGRDLLSRVLMQLGRATRWVDNPLVGAVRLGALPRLTRGTIDDAFVATLLRVLNANRDLPAPASTPDDGAEAPWWQEAVFYQIYPRSFQDSDGDGIGDLRGILSRLDHLQDLGVDAIWLSPVYDSPGHDNGYDIRDYRAILAEFGTMADFDELLAEVHRRGMRLIMDLVVNHTSDEHPWFQQALADPASPYRDYYFFRPGRGGGPPNDWTSLFSGPAWRSVPGEDTWAMHLFAPTQMDLDWTHAPMRAEIHDMVRWWLDKGVDGFRLDVINFISKPDDLPDGHRFVGELMGHRGIEHYVAGPRLHEHLRELRAEAFAPYGAVSVGETPGVGAQLARLLSAPDRAELDLVFGFDHLDMPGRTRWDDYRYDLRYFRDHAEMWAREYGAAGWPTLFFDNHDNPRMLSKVDRRPRHRTAVGALLAVLQLTLRGTPFLYQGQEYGAVDVAFTGIEQMRDVESLRRYGHLRDEGVDADTAFAAVIAGARDHARVPMAWDGGDGAGFTTGTPWLAGDGDHRRWNVAAAAADPGSVLSMHRRLIALRRAHPALRTGDITFARRRRHVWQYTRTGAGERITVTANLTDRPRRARIPRGDRVLLSTLPGEVPDAASRRTGLLLAPYQAVVTASAAG